MDYRELLTGADGARIAAALLRLRAALSASIPPKTLGDCLLLASWNLRDFGKGKHGGRSAEALAYIAEILSRFDLIAVQEVSADLEELDRVRRLLGRWWKHIHTDVTDGAAGNGERLAFLYDSRTVRHSGLAGEIVYLECDLAVGCSSAGQVCFPMRGLDRETAWCSFRCSDSTDCPSRICVSDFGTVDDGPRCHQICATDDDCADPDFGCFRAGLMTPRGNFDVNACFRDDDFVISPASRLRCSEPATCAGDEHRGDLVALRAHHGAGGRETRRARARAARRLVELGASCAMAPSVLGAWWGAWLEVHIGYGTGSSVAVGAGAAVGAAHQASPP